MNEKEFENLISQMREAGLNDDEIMHVLIETYKTNKCSIEDLECMVSWLGYQLTDDFYKDNGVKR